MKVKELVAELGKISPELDISFHVIFQDDPNEDEDDRYGGKNGVIINVIPRCENEFMEVDDGTELAEIECW